MELNGFETQKVFEYENGFYATADDRRFGKFIAHFKLYEKIINLPGAIVECGVFKGNSFFEFAHFRNLFSFFYQKTLKFLSGILNVLKCSKKK